MNKKRMIILIPLVILFVLIIFIKLDKNGAESSLVDKDEVIYLSYDNKEMPLDLTQYPVDAAPAPQDMLAEMMVIEPPEMGRLGVSSVIINKKSKQLESHLTAPAVQDNYFFDQNTEFLQQATKDRPEYNHALQQQDLAYKIFQGQRFNAVLTHAIHSDLPGMVVAEVSQDIYGYQANIPLLPTGTRLIGVYNSRMSVGNTRLYIVWQRAITPTGVDITLDSAASDRLGQSGLSGFVDTHFWDTFGTSALLSMMAVGASNLSDEQGEFSNQYQQGATDAMMDTSRSILSDRINQKPTIHIAQGEIIHVVVAKDLDFSAVMKTANEVAIF